MYKMCKTEQSANRQRELELGLLEVMRNCQYDEISISDLCDRLQIPRKCFYRYFSGKEGALRALIDHTMMQYELKNIYNSAGSAREELENFFEFWQEQKPLLDALDRSGLDAVLVERAIAYSLGGGDVRKPAVVDALGKGEQYAIIFAISGLMTMMILWHHSGYSMPKHQLAILAAEVMTRPLFEEA